MPIPEIDGGPIPVRVAHTIPGRTRLRLTGRQNRHVQALELAEQISKHPGVRRVSANAVTGSVLLEHDGTIAAIAADLEGVLQLVRDERVARRRPSAPSRGSGADGRAVLGAVALTCLMLSGWQLRRGRVLATASEHVWHSWHAWRNLKAPGLAAVLLGSGLVQLARGQVLSSAASLMYYAYNLYGTGRAGRGRAGDSN